MGDKYKRRTWRQRSQETTRGSPGRGPLKKFEGNGELAAAPEGQGDSGESKGVYGGVRRWSTGG